MHGEQSLPPLGSAGVVGVGSVGFDVIFGVEVNDLQYYAIIPHRYNAYKNKALKVECFEILRHLKRTHFAMSDFIQTANKTY